MITSLRGAGIIQTIAHLPRHCSGNAPSVPLSIVILVPTLSQNQVSMGLTTRRHRLARYFAMAAMVATSIALVLFVKRDGHGTDGDGAMLATLAGSFVYRPWVSPADPRQGYGKTLTVGKGKEFPTISLAVSAAQDGDIIAIAAGTYAGESMIIARNDLILRGQDGIATIDAAHTPLIQNKAILVTQGRNLLVENLELSGADSTHQNGAGIRAEGPSLHVRHCFIHDNQAGILVANQRDGTLLVEYSEFARNGHRSGQAHQIYAGLSAQLILRYNYIHDSFVGSAIKSRAARTVIAYNFLADGAAGSANYTVDLSNGGYAVLVGNVLEKASHAQNHTFISYAPESLAWPENALFMAYNTLVNDRFDGNFIHNHSRVELHAVNNLFIGRASLVEGGPVQLLGNSVMGNARYATTQDDRLGGSPGSDHNQVLAAVSIADRARLDYRLTPASPAIDAAGPLPAQFPAALTPVWQYRHPTDRILRSQVGALSDAGAFEFVAPAAAGAMATP